MQNMMKTAGLQLQLQLPLSPGLLAKYQVYELWLHFDSTGQAALHN